MTRYQFALFAGVAVVGLLGFTAARGQTFDLPPAPRPDDIGPTGVDLGRSLLDDAAPGDSRASRLRLPDEGVPPESLAAPEPLDYHGYGDRPHSGDPAYDLWKDQPAFTESSGTWLRRGWWYTEVEAVVLNRHWKRDAVILGADTTANRLLKLNRSDPGSEGSVRFTLGRFLFRDVHNRDHTLDFTIFGGGEWEQHDTLTSGGGVQSLIVPQAVDNFNLSFDNSSAMSVNYTSDFTSIELNYRVRERMRRDRMELMPSGAWVRRANEGLTRHFLIGLRYFDLNDTLDWRASNIQTFNNADGRYLLNTQNDLFGLQIGYSLVLERDRWNLETFGKGGVFHNRVEADSRFAIADDPANSFTVHNRDDTLSFIGELQVIARYHLRPHLSLRAGWQMMYLTSVAQAPDQVNFSPDAGRFPTAGDPFFQGGLFGFEAYW